MPTFDVVVPCYNYARYLERCVKSVLTQEGADVRVLVIDDCSSDDSQLVGQRLAQEDSRVEYRRHAQNQGHIATYNEGLLGWAKADYCLLLSADDALAPGAFKRALAVFETSPDVGVVYGMARIIKRDDEFEFPSQNDFTSFQVMSGPNFLKYCCETGGNPVPTPTAIARTKLQQRIGGYRKDLPHTGDLEMWMRFAHNGSIGIVRSVQGEYRRHDSNMSAQYYARLLSDKNELELTYLESLKPILAKSPEANGWLATMYSGLLAEAYRNMISAFDTGNREAFAAWSEFAKRIATQQSLSQRPWRLAIRELVGPPVWRQIRRIRRALNPNLSEPGNSAWNPAHGDVIGAWPTPA